jgi:hypothetical protein
MFVFLGQSLDGSSSYQSTPGGPYQSSSRYSNLELRETEQVISHDRCYYRWSRLVAAIGLVTGIAEALGIQCELSTSDVQLKALGSSFFVLYGDTWLSSEVFPSKLWL